MSNLKIPAVVRCKFCGRKTEILIDIETFIKVRQRFSTSENKNWVYYDRKKKKP